VKKKILALIAVLSLATVTACGQLNTAATLGDITISQASFEATVTELVKAREEFDTSQMQLEEGATLNRSQLRFFIITTIFDEIAKELKLGVTNSELTTTRTNMIEQSGGEAAFAKNLVAAQIAPSNFDAYVRAIIISDKINAALKASGIADADISARLSELVKAKAIELKISINPRYGTWDNTNGDIVPVDSAGDAVTSPSATN
jgi:hypothetical protein